MPRGERPHLRSRAQSSDSAASCAFAQSPRSPRPYRISQSIWFPLFRLKHPFYTQRPFASTGITPRGRRCRACGTFPSSYRSSAHLTATMASSDSSLRFRVCEVSQVPVRTFDTRPPALPRPLHTSYVVRRRTILASSNRRDWPADRDLHEALTHGSLALELMSSSDKTPARQSPSARPIFLLTFRHLYNGQRGQSPNEQFQRRAVGTVPAWSINSIRRLAVAETLFCESSP